MSVPNIVGVIPLHDHERWISSALLSMAGQSYRPCHVFVVDDGSTDNSAREVFALMDCHPIEEMISGLRVTHSEVRGVPVSLVQIPSATGPANARNIGIKMGWQMADAFAFLDSDDIYQPTKIEKSVQEWLRAPQEIGLVYSDYTTVNPEGKRSRQYKQVYDQKTLLRDCIVNCDSLVSKTALESVGGGFPSHLRVCEDYGLWLALARRFVFLHVADSLVDIRVGGHSASAQVPRERWNQDYRAAFEWAGYQLG